MASCAGSCPGTGLVQLYRIVDSLLDTQIVLSYYWKEIDVIPRRTLPPNALVLALSPLLDPRSVGALIDLRARGHDLAVIDVSPVPFTKRPAGGLDAIALRHLDASPRRATPPPAQHRRRGRRVGQRAAPAGRPGGGAGIQALRPARARLITALGALLTLGAACVYAAATAGRFAPIAIVTGALAVALLALGLVLRWPSMIPWTIILAGAGYLTAREGKDLVDGWAAVEGVPLLLAAELASWSIEHDARIRTEPALAIRRAVDARGTLRRRAARERDAPRQRPASPPPRECWSPRSASRPR